MLTNFWRRKPQSLPADASPADPASDETPPEGDEENHGRTRPSAPASFAAATTTLRDRLIVTWAVPEARVRPHLPEGILPDRLPFADGELRAFLQVEYALHQSPRLTRFPGISAGLVPGFHQVTYRILTRRAKDDRQVPGSFEVRTFVSVSELHVTKRAAQHQADFARFTVFVDGDPARGTYRLMRVRAGGDLGVTQLEIRGKEEAGPIPAPFASHDDLTRFLSQRDEVLFRASLPKNRIGLVPLNTPAPDKSKKAPPVRLGALVSARCTPWMDMKVLSAEELMAPLHITMQAETSVQALPPRFARPATLVERLP